MNCCFVVDRANRLAGTTRLNEQQTLASEAASRLFDRFARRRIRPVKVVEQQGDWMLVTD
jgi:hypothetical protein